MCVCEREREGGGKERINKRGGGKESINKRGERKRESVCVRECAKER